MAREHTRKQSGVARVDIPAGVGGLDLQTHPDLLLPGRLRRAENLDLRRGALERRRGSRRVSVITDPTETNGSWTFGTDAKHAYVNTNAQIAAIPVGGFAVLFHFEAVWPAAGKTAHIQASRKNGLAYGPLQASLSDAGVLTIAWRKQSDSSEVTVSSSAITNGADTHVIYLFDPVAGTTTLYINGEQDGQATGEASTDQPMTSSTDEWWFAVENEVGVGITTDSHFDGKLDAWTLLSLRGINVSAANSAGETFLAMLRRTTYQEWANPQSAMCLAHYGFDEASGIVLTDHSRFKNNGVLVGGPTSTARVALPAHIGQISQVITRRSGARDNIVMAGGDLYAQNIRSATA